MLKEEDPVPSLLCGDPEFLLVETIANRQKAEVNWGKSKLVYGSWGWGVCGPALCPISFCLWHFMRRQ